MNSVLLKLFCFASISIALVVILFEGANAEKATGILIEKDALLIHVNKTEIFDGGIINKDGKCTEIFYFKNYINLKNNTKNNVILNKDTINFEIETSNNVVKYRPLFNHNMEMIDYLEKIKSPSINETNSEYILINKPTEIKSGSDINLIIFTFSMEKNINSARLWINNYKSNEIVKLPIKGHRNLLISLKNVKKIASTIKKNHFNIEISLEQKNIDKNSWRTVDDALITLISEKNGEKLQSIDYNKKHPAKFLNPSDSIFSNHTFYVGNDYRGKYYLNYLSICGTYVPIALIEFK